VSASQTLNDLPPHGLVTVAREAGVATVTFGHPKGNSLPRQLLHQLAQAFDSVGADPQVKVVVLRSFGTGTFCSGASFEELRAIENEAQGSDFFSGFARVILAMRRCSKIIIGRIHGKAVGGGVGLVAASDYALALRNASVRLSEINLGIGPFVVGPVIERKIGPAAYAAMAIDGDWRDASWAEQHGLFSRVFDTEPALDSVLPAMAQRLAHLNPEALQALKQVLWEGTEHWEKLLLERAAVSGRLVITPAARAAIAQAAQATMRS
jgi:methylglutaconyl-CoA hydratase